MRTIEDHHAYTAPLHNEDWIKNVVIIGAGGFGRETAEIAKRIERSSRDICLIGFLDDNTNLHGKLINGVKVLGGLDYFTKYNHGDIYFVCALGDPKTKKKITIRALDYGYKPINIIDPDVDIFMGVKLGTGIVIQKGVCLAVNSEIGEHVHINFNCSIGHNVKLGAFTTVSPLCALSGFTHCGELCFFGTGVITFPSVIIEKETKIGAVSVVTKDINESGIYIGNPAKKVR